MMLCCCDLSSMRAAFVGSMLYSQYRRWLTWYDARQPNQCWLSCDGANCVVVLPQHYYGTPPMFLQDVLCQSKGFTRSSFPTLHDETPPAGLASPDKLPHSRLLVSTTTPSGPRALTLGGDPGVRTVQYRRHVGQSHAVTCPDLRSGEENPRHTIGCADARIDLVRWKNVGRDDVMCRRRRDFVLQRGDKSIRGIVLIRMLIAGTW